MIRLWRGGDEDSFDNDASVTGEMKSKREEDEEEQEEEEGEEGRVHTRAIHSCLHMAVVKSRGLPLTFSLDAPSSWSFESSTSPLLLYSNHSSASLRACRACVRAVRAHGSCAALRCCAVLSPSLVLWYDVLFSSSLNTTCNAGC